MDSNIPCDEGGRVMTRSRMLSKSRALSTAHSMAKSNLGYAVMKNSTTESTVHRIALHRLETENSWRLREIDKDRKQFLERASRRPGPILVVDRPPSVHLKETATMGQRRRSPGREEFDGPGYMRPTLRSSPTVPIIPTIDAYRTLCTRRVATTSGPGGTRKVTGTPAIRFRSAVLPSWPLTEQDQVELRLHWNQHWMRLRQQLQHQRQALRRSKSPSSSPGNSARGRPLSSAAAGVGCSSTKTSAERLLENDLEKSKDDETCNEHAYRDETFLTSEKSTKIKVPAVRFDDVSADCAVHRSADMKSTGQRRSLSAPQHLLRRPGTGTDCKSLLDSTSSSSCSIPLPAISCNGS